MEPSEPFREELQDALSPFAETLPPESDDARLVSVARRQFEKASKVTSDYVTRMSETDYSASISINSTQRLL